MLDKLVPHELNDHRKLRCYEVCPSLILRNKNYPFPGRVVTCGGKLIPYDIVKEMSNESHIQKIEEMHQKLSKKMSTVVNTKEPILLHDNARPHVSKTTLHKLSELEYETLFHPAYSPLAPTDFHLFKYLDNFLIKKIFKNNGDIKMALKARTSTQMK